MLAPDTLQILRDKYLNQINIADTVQSLGDIRVSALGKKGEISDLMKSLGGLSVDDKKTYGALLNILKTDISDAIDARHIILQDIELNARLSSQRLDVTLPVRPYSTGTMHPVSKVTTEVIAIFGAMGFSVADGPEIETEDYNFTKLNIPDDHPARQMHDTFYFSDMNDNGERPLLRTHTSPVQIRTMLSQTPPIRILAPGKTYRCDSDMTHTPMFHQVEGLVIEQGINMGHLRGTLQHFCETFFETKNITLRFRPSFFPFTEPSIEVDVKCNRQDGKILIGDGDDWLEILGAGMVHENVLKNCGYDPKSVQGFAFGMGIDRLAMLKYGLPDLRAFFESDLRWLKHYGFSIL